VNVSLRHLTKRFDANVVLHDISLEIQDGELFFLLGPSGCGKTTLLRLLAGFYEPDEGELRFGERRMNGVPPHQRNTGMVFQNYALWPHMTVAENIAYGLEVRGLDAAQRRQRIREALALVQLEAYADRSPNALSGGQQQRVALARALVIRPDVLLLDEPLSNLDARLRLELREEIRRIHERARITTVYVTHDQKESLSMADRMAVLNAGRVEQVGDPRAVYRAPANRFVAGFMGETNWMAGHVRDASAGVVRVQTEVGTMEVHTAESWSVGQPVWLGFRPEAVQVGEHAVNHLPTTITRVTYLGETEQYVLQASAGVSLKACEQNPLVIRSAGALLPVHVRPVDIFLLPRADQEPASG
jgi:iron(III) transport system ATP-binding protein